MKTYQEFIAEARRNTGLRGLRHGLGNSKSDAISKGFRFFRGNDGRIREIRNYGSQSRPGGRVVDYENETVRRIKRQQILHDVTPPEHQDHEAFARKSIQATRKGMDLHHMTPIAKSAEIKASMTDSEWQQRLKDDEKKGIYHGNHPRNLALTKRMGEKGPGISHHGTIHRAKRANQSWQEIATKVKEVRQQLRKRKKRTFEEFIAEAKKCWPGYKKKGTQKLFGKTYNRCVKAEEFEIEEDWSNEYKRSIDCSNPKGFSQKAHCAGRAKRKAGGETKSKSPFKEMYELELEESSTGERSGRRTRGNVTLARGRGADMTSSERTTASVAKKAGLKGTGKYSTKDLRKPARDYTTYDSEDTDDDVGSTEQDHFIRTYPSARAAAKGERLISKMKSVIKPVVGRPGITGTRTAHQTAPSSESVRRVKDLKKQMTKSGADKTGRVHTVDIMHRDSNLGKGDKHQQMERGRNFIQAIEDTPKHLKKAGAKRGDTVIGKPTAVMPGEKKETGEKKRARLYKRIFGKRSTKMSAKTGLMVGAVH